MDILNKKQKVIIIIIAAFMLLFVGYYIINKANNSKYIMIETEEKDMTESDNSNENSMIDSEKQKIIIHITGEVKRQGIVELNEGDRISDAINISGGTTEKADLSKINLAYCVEDGQKIYIPSRDDLKNASNDILTKDAGANVIQNNNIKSDKVNINTASQTELETLSGIGPSTALKIINYREENGKFKKIEDLKKVPGIGETKFESLKESICIK